MMESAAENTSNNLNEDDRFSCNICLQSLSEPVTTRCGHLFCWSCLYRWLEPGMTAEEQDYLFPNGGARQLRLTVNPSRRKCPVCKATCTVNNTIPIYVRDCARDHDEGMGHKNKNKNGETVNDSNRNQEEKEIEEEGEEDLLSQDYNGNPAEHETESSAAEYVDSISSQTGLRRRTGQRIMHASTSTSSPSSNDENSSVSEIPVQSQSQSYTSPSTEISPDHTNGDISSHSLSAIPSRPQPPAPRDDPSLAASNSNQMTTNNNHHVRLNAIHNRNPLQHALFDALYDIQSQIDNRRTTGASAAEGNNSGTDDQQQNAASRPMNIPSLHNRNQNGFANGNRHDGGRDDDDLGYGATTDFLGRVLLMLGSLVILILLVF